MIQLYIDKEELLVIKLTIKSVI